MMEGVPFVQVLHRWRLDCLAIQPLIERSLPRNNQKNSDPEGKLNGPGWCLFVSTCHMTNLTDQVILAK